MDVNNLSVYICKRYRQEYNKEIDEMKLHKLLYFCQRESFVINNKALFSDQFQGWKYGPVMVKVRRNYNKILESSHTAKNNLYFDDNFIDIMDSVFSRYAWKSAISLCRLSHNEQSWINSRLGMDSNQKNSKHMKTSDIRIDANRIKIRRYLLKVNSNESK